MIKKLLLNTNKFNGLDVIYMEEIKKIIQFLRKPSKLLFAARQSVEQVESLLGKLSLISTCSCLKLLSINKKGCKRDWSPASTNFFKEV